MSIVSPKTGRLIKIGSKAYSDLLKDPKYKDSLFNPSKSPDLVKGKVSPSGLPPLKNMSNLPSLPKSPSAPTVKLPPLPNSPKSNSLKLPPLPISPSRSRISPYSPPSPSISLNDYPMTVLPPLPVSKTLNSLPVLNIPIKTSPSIKLAGKMEKTSKLPSLSPKRDSSPKQDIEEILAMPFYDIPTLEETLKNTKQPSKRAKIEEMIREKRYEEGRGIKTRGWLARAPTRGKERHQLHAECGDKCFLLPESEKFPICASPRVTGGKSVCEIDCAGVQSALIRSKQWKYDEVSKKAEKILEKCNESGLEHFIPSKLPPAPSKLSPKLSPSAQMAGLMPRRVARRTSRRTSNRNVELSPSMSEYTPDCGCGN